MQVKTQKEKQRGGGHEEEQKKTGFKYTTENDYKVETPAETQLN